MLDEVTEVPEPEHLVRDLERAGFTQPSVDRALCWLAELACEREMHEWPAAAGNATRIYSEWELGRLSTECRGLLLKLERLGALSPRQRELVIERLLALDVELLEVEQLRWVALMVLTSQPEPERSLEQLAALVSGASVSAAH